MENYKITKQIGSGVYGEVLRGVNLKTLEIVAIKRMKKKFNNWNDCLQLREIKVLRELNHPNIVKLKDVILEGNDLFLVFEYLENNLYEIIKDRSKLLPESKIRNIIYQIIQALHSMHQHNYFHRDLKPENILLLNETVKLADFGLAREIQSKPPFTDYISTRWYRAPEVLLRSTQYNAQIDIWAIGAIMAELYSLKPLFPGSSEIDQLFKICSVLGSPTPQTWNDGIKLAGSMNFKFPHMSPNSLSNLLPNASTDAIDLMYELLKYDPTKRLSTASALNHPYFHVSLPKPILLHHNNNYSDLANVYLFQNGYIQSNELKFNQQQQQQQQQQQNSESASNNNNNIQPITPKPAIKLNQNLRNSRYSILNFNSPPQYNTTLNILSTTTTTTTTSVNLNSSFSSQHQQLLPNYDLVNSLNNSSLDIDKQQIINKIKQNNNNNSNINNSKLITPRSSTNVQQIPPPMSNINPPHNLILKPSGGLSPQLPYQSLHYHSPIKITQPPPNTSSKL
ncbi:putative protein serine/threonine kinase [Tieghemostelium lacteum]|uniref:Protein kinase domain-containing protein n=1 Tax=Tieghemostelium lacteum TaxID=361077 RepID=A0A151ZB87_TIELA|nr:putative protein serine/threonine kinase [Tieghemostelium lacteum]|eukprot:KYQ91210.1 putative protein serine/threonine kinase [Tieghemostelium lacteum]